jgi:two-component sensor histidine kinase/CheY-like chemotaxis protein
MRVIMVDDSAADRKLYRMLLETRYPKLEFFEAADGSAGLACCRNHAPDCILLDYKLPDMTGLEFLARLTGDQRSEVPPFAVVMLTGLASEPVAVDALKAGAQDYLSKDRITAESLSMVVEKATQKVSLIRDLKAERDRLARSLAEKDVLLQEVHHRVKNNLQVIVSLLRLQANAIHDGRLAAALRESQNRVETMALIHEQLYQTRDLRQVDLARHASLLATSLLHSYGVEESRIALRVEVEPIPIAMDRAIPAGLILNELISNALKHGFPDGRRGSIVIKGVRCGDRIVLEVRDDGVGLPPTVETQQPKSLGLQIVQILSRQLKGAFEAGSGPGGVFRVIFPKGES